MSERDRVQFLLWRAGFGATPAQVDAATAKGYAATVDDLLNYADAPADAPQVPAMPAPLPKNPTGDEKTAFAKARNEAVSAGRKIATNWWATLLKTSGTPLQENLTLFWHNHFATSDEKVRHPGFMMQQNQLFREKGAGKFVDLLMAVSKDPAMLIWLDGQSSVKGHPNENWSREVMELFTLGIGNYTETDVREGARASTGWTLNEQTGEVKFVANRFDSGSKTVLGQSGNLSMDDFSRLLAGHPETAKYVSRKLFWWFAGDTPSDSDLQPMTDAWSATGGDIRSVLRALFTSDAFSPDHSAGNRIKNPVAWTVGALRGLGADLGSDVMGQMLQMQGMILFDPPNVGGWSQGGAWISPSSQVLRFNLAGQLLTKTGMLNGAANDDTLNQIVDRLGSFPLTDDLRAKLLDLGKGADGQRAIAQILLAGPGYQAR